MIDVMLHCPQCGDQIIKTVTEQEMTNKPTNTNIICAHFCARCGHLLMEEKVIMQEDEDTTVFGGKIEGFLGLLSRTFGNAFKSQS